MKRTGTHLRNRTVIETIDAWGNVLGPIGGVLFAFGWAWLAGWVWWL